jgi:hypothetical protein
MSLHDVGILTKNISRLSEEKKFLHANINYFAAECDFLTTFLCLCHSFTSHLHLFNSYVIVLYLLDLNLPLTRL